MKVRDVLRLLREDGWVLAPTPGRHQQFKHPTKPGRVTVAGRANDDLAPGTLNSILTQAGLKPPWRLAGVAAGSGGTVCAQALAALVSSAQMMWSVAAERYPSGRANGIRRGSQ